MIIYRAFALFPLLFSLAACKNETPTATSADADQKVVVAKENLKSESRVINFVPPEPNLSSPDNSVKSWWALNDAIAKEYNEECKRGDPRSEAFQAARRALATGGTKEYFQKTNNCRLSEYDRTIERASVETETRAVVLANIKNATRLPDGVSLSKYAKENVEKGLSYKYVLARESDKWYVDEVYVYDSTNVYLKRDPWRREYKNEKNEEVYLGVYQQ